MNHLKRYFIIGVFALLLGVLTIPAKAYIQRPGVVTQTATLRRDADKSSQKLAKLAAGQEVKVNNEITTDSGEVWCQIYTDDGVVGYVPKSKIYIEADKQTMQSEAQAQVVTVTERIGTVTAQSAIRVRENASTGSVQIASMVTGDTFLVLADETGADGYVWHKIEFDDNGTIVYGYVRSDLVSVKEVVSEEYVQIQTEYPTESHVANPTVDSVSEDATAPYNIVSQKSVTGKTKWYLVDLENGDTTEIEFLLSGGVASLREKVNVGIYKCLILAAVCVAIYFYTRWREAVREAKKRISS